MSEPMNNFNYGSNMQPGSMPMPSNMGLPPHDPGFHYVPAGMHQVSGVQANQPPPVPPRIDLNQALAQPSYGNQMGTYGGMGSMGGMGAYGGMGSYGGIGSYGGMGMGMGGYGGYGGLGGYGMGGMGGMYGGYNRFMDNYETRFIQMAEERSRPAFESIQSLVNAVGSVAMMLESTFFAMTSSFRAVLGVAENVGRLRSLFAQFWSTFAVVRTLNWIIRKLMVLIGIRTENEFQAWAEAVASTQQNGLPAQGPEGIRYSGWPVIMFFAVVAAAPYIVLKMMTRLNTTIQENLADPATWQNPPKAVANYTFTATSPQELTLHENQIFQVAPMQLQQHLMHSGWLMASTDGKTAGLVPVNYFRIITPAPTEQNQGNNTQNIAPPPGLQKKTT